MAGHAFTFLFFGLVGFGIALKKQFDLGVKPEDPVSRAGFAYENARRHVQPWWWGTWALFTLGGLLSLAVTLGFCPA